MGNKNNSQRSNGGKDKIDRNGSAGRVNGSGNNATKGGYKPNSGGKKGK